MKGRRIGWDRRAEERRGEERREEERRGFYKGQTVPLTRRLPPAYTGLVTLLILFQVWESWKH